MKKSLTLLLLAFITLFASAGKKSREIKQYDGISPRMGAMVYALPKVDIQIEVGATCIISKPGPFAQYAERYLGEANAITRESKIWRFDNVKIKENLVADSSKMYLITGESQQISFFKGDILIKSVGECVNDNHDKKHDHHHKPRKDEVDTLFHTELLGEESLTSTSIPKMAERAAKQIFQLREARMAILSCDVNHQPDGEATKAILERIDRDERELTALFIGKRVYMRSSSCFAIDPHIKKNNVIIARMSTMEGIVPADDMIGTPIYVNINPTMLQAPAENKKSQKAKHGYFYNVPGSAEIEVRHGENFKLTRTMQIPQNGYAIWLAPAVSHIVFNKNGTIKTCK